MRSSFRTTRDAGIRLATAHVDLARAEAKAIGGEVAKVAALAGVALAVLLFAGILAVVGTALYLADWLLGSMGWGVLHGVLLLVAIAVGCGLAAVGVGAGRIALALLGAIVVGVIGAISAIVVGPQVGAGIGIALGLMTWIVLMGVGVARTGVDLDRLKARFYPTQTIETSKETLEWLQSKMPPGTGS